MNSFTEVLSIKTSQCGRIATMIPNQIRHEQKIPHDQIEILFVHLGESPCPHLWLNIRRTKGMFPNQNIHLLIDSMTHAKNIPEYVNVIFYREIEVLDWNKNRDLVFRRGFWKHSLNRLFALAYCHQQIGNKPILHVESDILLLPDFPWARFSNLDRIFWQPYNDTRDVASLLFLPNHEATNRFRDSLLRNFEINSSHTDMSILKEIALKGEVQMGYLPILNESLNSLINKNTKTNIEQIMRYQTNEFYDGLFDSAAIGMWLLGHDPRNTYGKFLLHENSPIASGDSLVDASGPSYFLSPDGCLKLKNPNNSAIGVSCWTLHVHSKSLALFSKKWKEELAKYVDLANNQPELIQSFRPKTLITMFLDSMSTRTPHKFFLGFPIVHKLRSFVYEGKKRLQRAEE